MHAFTEGQILYRAESFDGHYISYERFVVTKVTPSGGWIMSESDYDLLRQLWQLDPEEYELCLPGLKRRWVAQEGRKRFAYPTEEEALQSLQARVSSYLGHCRRRLTAAEEKHRRLCEREPQQSPRLRKGIFDTLMGARVHD